MKQSNTAQNIQQYIHSVRVRVRVRVRVKLEYPLGVHKVPSGAKKEAMCRRSLV